MKHQQSADGPPLSSLELERRAFRRRQSVGSVVLGAASTVVFGVLVWFFVINTPGWARVQESFFDLDSAAAALPRVGEGFLVNLRILGVAVVGVAIVATLIAFLRTLRGPVFFPLRALAAAYVSEVIRAGIEGVHPSQRMGARALGLTHGQTLRMIVLPQAIRRQAPPLMNDFVAMQKDVGLVSILGVVDAVRGAQIETSKVADFTPYILAAVLFVLLAIPTIRLADWVTARLRRREQMGAIV